MNKNDLKEMTIGEIVVRDFRTASVFKDNGIDFCCGGKQYMEPVCKEIGVEFAEIEKQILDLQLVPKGSAHNFDEWELPFLCDYIINNHHKYVTKTLPELMFYTQKIANVHGEHHPELVQIASVFSDINTELKQHLENEEEVLFPAIKRAVSFSDSNNGNIIHSEIERMSSEHDFAGNSMHEINRLSKGYLTPEDACNTYKVTFQMLKQFEDDLHVHVHLENNILFPKALKL